LIQQRNPVEDANKAWLDGSTAFLPSGPGGNIFPGLERAEFNLKKDFGSQNYEKLLQSELPRYLETLMGDDPLQVQHPKVPYFSKQYKEFIHSGWKYREAFNKEIYSRLQSSNQPHGANSRRARLYGLESRRTAAVVHAERYVTDDK
jgi:hypothetical protein